MGAVWLIKLLDWRLVAAPPIVNWGRGVLLPTGQFAKNMVCHGAVCAPGVVHPPFFFGQDVLRNPLVTVYLCSRGGALSAQIAEYGEVHWGVVPWEVQRMWCGERGRDLVWDKVPVLSPCFFLLSGADPGFLVLEKSHIRCVCGGVFSFVDHGVLEVFG